MTAPVQGFTPAMARRIELWPLDRLRPYARNARTHSDAQVAQVAASIVEFGWTSPILVDGDGGVIAGHARLLAALRECDALVHVVRLFENPAMPHPRARLDPVRDIAEIAAELAFADLSIAETRIEKLKKSVAHPTPHQAEEKQGNVKA